MKTKRFLLCISTLLGVWAVTAYAQGGLDQRVAELSQQIAKEMTEYQKTTIAVVEFSDLQGNVTDFGRFLAEKLITRLYQTKKFKVIERQLLKKVITEQKLSLTGMVDPTSAKQLGKILGVDAVCSGSITDLAQSLDVNARLISTETGEIFAVASTEIFKDESVMKLLAGATAQQPQATKPTTRLTTPAQATVRKVETNNFTFELKEWKMSGGTLTFDLLITSNLEDAYLQIGLRGSRIIDDSGNEYILGVAQLGKKEYGNYLTTGVPMRAVLTFDKVSPEVTTLKVLEIYCQGQGRGKDFTVQFRDLPITK